jgi:Polyketide cyclase / dehydrase and lipid transport
MARGGKMRFFRAAFFMAGLWALSTGGSAPPAGRVQFTFRQEGDRYDFDGKFIVDAGARTAWEVLTDYDHFSRFISNMHCHVRRREGNDLWVEQTVGGGFLFIREEVKGLLEIREEPLRGLSLREVSHQNFDSYFGQWEIQPDPSGKQLVITYRLEAERNRRTPSFVTPRLFRRSSEDLMVEMRREILRREARAESLPAVKGGAG